MFSSDENASVYFCVTRSGPAHLLHPGSQVAVSAFFALEFLYRFSTSTFILQHHASNALFFLLIFIQKHESEVTSNLRPPLLGNTPAPFPTTVARMLLFSMGAVGTAVTTLRRWKVALLYQLYGSQTNSPRWIIEITHVVLLSQIEISIIVMCANLPGLAAWLKRSLGSRSASGGGGSSSSRRWRLCSRTLNNYSLGYGLSGGGVACCCRDQERQRRKRQPPHSRRRRWWRWCWCHRNVWFGQCCLWRRLEQ
jgi:uncharacterized membrane protein YgcG